MKIVGRTWRFENNLGILNSQNIKTYSIAEEFSRSGPIGQLFDAIGPRLKLEGSRVAIVGLGAGTLGCYAGPGQDWTFYEIDPALVTTEFDTYAWETRLRALVPSVLAPVGAHTLSVQWSTIDPTATLVIVNASSSRTSGEPPGSTSPV